MFDWYRFARELWDWWWYPFDFNDTFTTTAVPTRPMLKSASRYTVDRIFLREYALGQSARPVSGAYCSSGWATGGLAGRDRVRRIRFRLETGTPIYAMANGFPCCRAG